MLVKKYILPVLLMVLSVTAQAQNGIVRGVIKDKKTGETLIGANVILKGTTQGTITDFEGKFELKLSPGVHEILFSYISYAEQMVPVTVVAGVNPELSIELTEATVELEGVVVTAVRRTNTDMAMISSIKSANVVASGISSQQISRSQDRDASEVVKRISGISVVDDRFVVVRGLNQRYNGTWLNHTATPGSEADSRAFSFDAVPSSMIDNLVVAKSPSADLPADFAGGFIQIQTKGMPDKDFVQFSYSTSYVEGTTFNDFYSDQRGNTDYLGYDNSFRVLPSDMPANLNRLTVDQRNAIGKKFATNWDAAKSTAIPDQRGSITLGKRLDKAQYSLGTLTAITYGTSFDTNEINNRGYQSYKEDIGYSPLDFDYTDRHYVRTYKLGLLHNWAWVRKGNKIEFRNLFNQIGRNSTTFREGDEFLNVKRIKSYEYYYRSRSNYSGQLSGDHKLTNELTHIDWALGYSFANRKEPDLRRLETKRVQGAETPAAEDDLYKLSINYSVTPEFAGRLFSKLNEQIYSGGLNLSHKLEFGSFKPELKTGVYAELKKRDFSIRLLGYQQGFDFDPSFGELTPGVTFNQLLNADNLASTGGLQFGETTKKSDSYDASNQNIAGYISGVLPIGSYLNISAGVRFENNVQQLNSFSILEQPLKIENPQLSVLPSINITYNLNEKNLLRFAYGKSVNRPEFREIAPFYFYDFAENRSVGGNSTLKIASIQNFDLRYEFYPSQGETFSLGAFYKDFTNPIEMVFVYGSNSYTFANAKGATNLGVEAEVRKSLDDMGLPHFSTVLNASYIYSKVEFNNNVQERDRPMQGQSPYLINAGLFYNNEKNGWGGSVLYNVAGARIMAVGTVYDNPVEDIPDIYEMPRHEIDVTLSKRIGNYLEIKGGVKDILNQEVVFQQSVKDGNEKVITTNRTKFYVPGRSFNLGLTLTF